MCPSRFLCTFWGLNLKVLAVTEFAPSAAFSTPQQPVRDPVYNM